MRAVCVYSDVWFYLYIPGPVTRSVLLLFASIYLLTICPLANVRSIDRSIDLTDDARRRPRKRETRGDDDRSRRR